MTRGITLLVLLALTAPVAQAFLAPSPLMLRPGARCSVARGPRMEDGIDSKKVAGAIGGVFKNLKNGKGLFGEETTQKFARQALDTVEGQLQEVVEEIRAEEGAKSIKSTSKEMKSAAPVVPKYSKDDKWDVIVAEVGDGSPMEVTVRPTQKASLLLKAWCGDNGADPADCEMVVKQKSWKTGVVDLDEEIGESGILDGMTVYVRGK